MMAAVHYKFKSSKDYKSLVIEGPSISVADLKLTIVESMHLKRPANFILLVFDAQTNEEYLDEATLIPRDTSVIVHRVPRGLRMPITEDNDWHDFGDLCTIDSFEVQSTNTMQDAPSGSMISKVEEDRRIKALINTWLANSGFLIKSLSLFWRIYGWKNEYQGTEHLMQGEASNRHSEVNAHDNFDGSYALTGGVVLCSEAPMTTFEREMEGLPSTRSAIDVPAELHCPLCKGVMKDAVMTGKCCYRSFCDKCIRDCIISKSMCACGATNILADDLVPNKNVRDLIESCQLAKPPLPSHSADLKRKREIEHIIERSVTSRMGMVFLENSVAIHEEPRGLEGDAIFLAQGNKNV
ncbi:hypothetical protein Syun_029236 [Stephania yunnanensis]|uniref:DWNN domain-containing protein n=1 Tax=Stephania yunnanensis TaxID=152371 RepID=A0AAP0E8L2_9MAGN